MCIRYGWRSLPSSVQKDELDLLLQLIPPGENKDTILDWYLLDENSIAPFYVLQNISHMKLKPIAHPDFWLSAQNIIRSTIWTAIENNSTMVADQIQRNWTISVTEREVEQGMFCEDVDLNNVQVLLRTLTDHSLATETLRNIYFTGPTEDKALLNALRTRVYASHKKVEEIDNFCLQQYSIAWDEATGVSFSAHTEYIRRIASDFTTHIIHTIDKFASKIEYIKSLHQDIIHHGFYVSSRKDLVLPRSNEREKISNLLR